MDVKSVLMNPAHELLSAEYDRIATSGQAVTPPPEGDWVDTFRQHPHREGDEGDRRPCFPVAMYVDGIKYTRAIGPGKADSVVAFTTYNLATGCRHLLAALSKRQMCKCGCKGWDTLHGVFNYLRWCFAAAAKGERPASRWDGTAWPEAQGSGKVTICPLGRKGVF